MTTMHLILNAHYDAEGWVGMYDVWESPTDVIDPEDRYDEMARFAVMLADRLGGIHGSAHFQMRWDCRDEQGVTVASESVRAFINLLDCDTYSVRFSRHNRTRAYREVAVVDMTLDQIGSDPVYVYDITAR